MLRITFLPVGLENVKLFVIAMSLRGTLDGRTKGLPLARSRDFTFTLHLPVTISTYAIKARRSGTPRRDAQKAPERKITVENALNLNDLIYSFL